MSIRDREHVEPREPQAELYRLQARELLNQTLMAETLDELMAVIQPQNLISGRTQIGTSQSGNSPQLLLMVAGAVGKAMGITIRPPSQSDDFSRLQNPLEAIARASRFRLRQIALRGKWWTDLTPKKWTFPKSR